MQGKINIVHFADEKKMKTSSDKDIISEHWNTTVLNKYWFFHWIKICSFRYEFLEWFNGVFDNSKQIPTFHHASLKFPFL